MGGAGYGVGLGDQRRNIGMRPGPRQIVVALKLNFNSLVIQGVKVCVQLEGRFRLAVLFCKPETKAG